MVYGFADNRRRTSLATRMRRERFGIFCRALCDWFPDADRPLRILDIGGTEGFWRHHADLLQATGLATELTLLNRREAAPREPGPDLRWVDGDARDLSFLAAGEIDVAFSNSVIEHVGTLADQMAMAEEIRRVAGRHFVQTPNRRFPLEPHFLVPFWQYLPISLRTFALRRRGIGWKPRTPDYLLARAEVEQIRLLTRRELRHLFPGSRVVTERILGLAKSFVVLSPPGPGG